MASSVMRRMAAPANRAYCLQQLRAHDHENYLASLLHPSKVTQFLHASTRALNVELANIRATVSNEDLGRLRVAFFRDGLSSVVAGKSPPGAPVLDVLAEAASQFPEVSFDPLHCLINARERDLAYPSMASLEDLRAFASDTQGSLISVHAAALARSGTDQPLLRSVSSEAGKAIGLAILLRGTAAHASSRLSYMPRDLVRESGVSQNELLSGGENACHLFRTVASAADVHLSQARKQLSGVDPKTRPAFWPLHMAAIYLRRLRKAGFDPFNKQLQVGMRTTYSLALQTKLLGVRLMGG